MGLLCVGARDPCCPVWRQGSRALCLLLPVKDGHLPLSFGRRRQLDLSYEAESLGRQRQGVAGSLNVSHGTGVIPMGCNYFARQSSPLLIARRRTPATGGAPSPRAFPGIGHGGTVIQ